MAFFFFCNILEKQDENFGRLERYSKAWYNFELIILTFECNCFFNGKGSSATACKKKCFFF